MNIALPALVVLIGLLPGIAVYYSYFAGRFEKRRAGVSALEEAALYVLFSIPIDVISFLLLRSLGIRLDLGTVGHLLAGNVPESEISRIATQIESHAALTAFSYLGVVVASAVLGWVARLIVWNLRIDAHIELFRWRHPWYYMFEGRHRSLPPGALAWVDVLVEHAEDKTRLYRGLVSDYDMAPDGKLESITLNGARRGRGRGDKFEWIDIPSSHLVLMGCKIHSINVTYYDINDEPDPSELNKAEAVPDTVVIPQPCNQCGKQIDADCAILPFSADSRTTADAECPWCGKTTTLNVPSRLVRVTKGHEPEKAET